MYNLKNSENLNMISGSSVPTLSSKEQRELFESYDIVLLGYRGNIDDSWVSRKLESTGRVVRGEEKIIPSSHGERRSFIIRQILKLS